MVYDARDKILGRLASKVAKDMISARKSGLQQRVIVINAEEAIVSGHRTKILKQYREKYNLNHPRKGPFFPRMPDKILKRTVIINKTFLSNQLSLIDLLLLTHLACPIGLD